jgi:hypothetical protein
MSLFPRHTEPGGTIIVHVRLEREYGPAARWTLEATLAAPGGTEHARFTARGEMAPGRGRLDRWFAWRSAPDDPLGRYEARLAAAIGDVVVGSSTVADDHVYLERLEQIDGRLCNPGPTPVQACLLTDEGTAVTKVVVPPHSMIDPPAIAAFVTWADARVLKLSPATD